MTLRSDDEDLGTLKPEELMTSETKRGLYGIIGVSSPPTQQKNSESRTGWRIFFGGNCRNNNPSNSTFIWIDFKHSYSFMNSTYICLFVFQPPLRIRERKRNEDLELIRLFFFSVGVKPTLCLKNTNFFKHFASFLCAVINKKWKESNIIVQDCYFSQMYCHPEKFVGFVNIPLFSLFPLQSSSSGASWLKETLIIFWVMNRNHSKEYFNIMIILNKRMKTDIGFSLLLGRRNVRDKGDREDFKDG